MMFLDCLLELSKEQKVTATAASTNVVDFGSKSPTLGLSEPPLYLVVTVPTAFSGLTNLTVALQDADSDSGAWNDVVKGAPLTVAELKAGASYVLPLPVKHKRFVRAHYTVNGTANAGAVSAYITTSIQQNTPQPDAPRAWGGR